jgi:hypothetical protein
VTIRDYITSKLSPLRLQLSEADWSDISKKINPEAEDTDDNIKAAFTVLATRVLPFYVNQAKSVSENGFSISFDGDGVQNFYAWLCRDLGIADTLNKKPRITFL